MTARTITLACLAAVALAGCADTNAYVDKVNEIQSDVLEASSAISSDPNATKNKVLESLEAAKSEAEAAVAELSEVDIPSDAEAGHEELVAGFEELSALLEDVRDQVESSEGGAAFAEFRSEGAKIDRQIDQAIDQINSDLGLE